MSDSDDDVMSQLKAVTDAIDAEQVAMEVEAQPWTITVEARPTVIPTREGASMADFSWAVKVSTMGRSKMYLVGGEADGPFRAIQRAIDKHAFKSEV